MPIDQPVECLARFDCEFQPCNRVGQEPAGCALSQKRQSPPQKIGIKRWMQAKCRFRCKQQARQLAQGSGAAERIRISIAQLRAIGVGGAHAGMGRGIKDRDPVTLLDKCKRCRHAYNTSANHYDIKFVLHGQCVPCYLMALGNILLCVRRHLILSLP